MTTTITELKLADIKPAPDNPRKTLGDLTELAASLGELGMLQPLVVTPNGKGYTLVIGHRRHAAAKKAKLATAPAIIRELTDTERIEAMLVENCQRTDLTALEEAAGYAQLVELGLSQRAIAKAVGKSQAHISKRLQLLDLPERVTEALDSGGITVSDALEIVAIKDHPQEVKRVLEQTYGDVAYRVRLAQDEIKRKQTVDAAKASIEKKGIAYVKVGDYGDPTAPAMRIGTGWHRLPVNEKAHAKLDCHACGVDRFGKIVAICTDPSKHPKELKELESPGGLSMSRRLTPAEKAAEQLRKELALDEERRLEEIKAIATAGKISPGDIAELNLYALFAIDYYDPIGWVCRMLEIPIETAINDAREAETVDEAETAPDEDPYKDLDPEVGEGAIAAYAAASSANRLRATFALAACIVEDCYCRNYYSPWAAPAKALLDVLVRHGYELTPAERNKLADAAKEEAKAA